MTNLSNQTRTSKVRLPIRKEKTSIASDLFPSVHSESRRGTAFGFPSSEAAEPTADQDEGSGAAHISTRKGNIDR